jgi:hypothetical protein
LILIGFAGAFRRSELCAMTVSDLCFSDSGVVISVPCSKADQEQAGDKVAIPFGEHDDTCPIKAPHRWLSTAKVIEGAVFRGVDRFGRVAPTGLHRDSIAAIFKTAASRACMNATNIAGHSVRAGMATQAALNGSSERATAKPRGTVRVVFCGATSGPARCSARTQARVWVFDQTRDARPHCCSCVRGSSR